jgi:hypothetical protein
MYPYYEGDRGDILFVTTNLVFEKHRFVITIETQSGEIISSKIKHDTRCPCRKPINKNNAKPY